MSFQLNDYIKKNYGKFLDYAKFHADKNGLTGMGPELLQFTFEIVFADMERSKINELLNKKYGNYNELHAYILGIIKINAFSPRSDFRRKILQRLPIDQNVKIHRLQLVDESFNPHDYDSSEELFCRFERVRNELEILEVSDFAKEVFRFKFFLGNNLSEWPGPEPKSKLYKIYNQVLDALKTKIRKVNQLQLF